MIFEITTLDRDGCGQNFTVEAVSMNLMYRELWAKYGSKDHQLAFYKHEDKGPLAAFLPDGRSNPNFDWVHDLESDNAKKVTGVYISGPNDVEIYCDQVNVLSVEEFRQQALPI